MKENEKKTELPNENLNDSDLPLDTEEADVKASDIPAEVADDEDDAVPATFATVKVFSKEKRSGQPERRKTEPEAKKANEVPTGAKKPQAPMKKRPAIFDGFTLKMIAVVTMLIDHCAAVFLNGTWKEDSFSDPIWVLYNAMRLIGRFSFPIFCFVLVEGFFHTRSRVKYAIRLAAFAVLSEIPFDLALTSKNVKLSDRFFAWDKQNVFITLLIGFLVIWGIEWWLRPWIERKKAPRTFSEISKFFLPMLGFVILGGLASVFSKCDYGLGGLIVIVFIYFSHGELHPGLNMIRSGIILAILAGRSEAIAVAGYPLTEFYSEQRGRSWKWFFYIFYPAHLLLLFLLHELL